MDELLVVKLKNRRGKERLLPVKREEPFCVFCESFSAPAVEAAASFYVVISSIMNNLIAKQ
ncbi:hypothetical protein [Saccharococcus caldoxylosilyticus]|uniref:hypothetical protein n=1 Tax=Saccharococcus caldoxylosilyticus TaxID=81408 RepID=UPI0012DF1D46|nr:hypothetical protein [Parageobacillus caldoxylosilyticus]MBB3852219.1 hypothetical protein [Parageobacillus caldoxylosilyticus]